MSGQTLPKISIRTLRVVVFDQCELGRKAVAVVLVHEGHLFCLAEKRFDRLHGSCAWAFRPVCRSDRWMQGEIGEVAASGDLCCHLKKLRSLGSESLFRNRLVTVFDSVRPESNLIPDQYCFVSGTHEGTNEMKFETEKEIEYESTIMEMRNVIKNQERVIEELMLNILNIKIENEQIENK
jgi:hypothetical protein